MEKFFDTINQSQLIQILGNTVKGGRVISLIHKIGYRSGFDYMTLEAYYDAWKRPEQAA